MLRLCFVLGAAIYAGLVIASERMPDIPLEVDQDNPGLDASLPAAATRADVLRTQDGRALTITAVIDPAENVAADAVILVSTRIGGGETVTVSASVGARDYPLVVVTGDRVNLRTGPSTGTEVLGALVRGDRAELIAAEGGGWVQIRAVATGVEGYMAARFVAAVN